MPRGTNPLDRAKVQGLLWTPDAIRPLLGAWYDASNRASLTLSSGTITDLADLSGKSRPLTQGTSANRPNWLETGWDGDMPCIQTVDAGDRLSTASAYTPACNFSVFTSVNRAAQTSDSASTPRCIFSCFTTGDDTSTDDRHLFSYRTGTGTLTVNHVSAGGNFSSNTAIHSFATPLSQDTKAIISASYPYTYTNTRIRLNGNVGSDISTVPSSIGYSGNLFTIMGQADSDLRTWLGKMGEFILIETATTGRLTQVIEGYLAWKWNTQSLAADHPFRNRPPMIGD